MDKTVLIFSLLAVILLIINIKKGTYLNGLKNGAKQLFQALPIIIVAFLLAGLIKTLIPDIFIQQWLTHEAGVRGIIIGAFGGFLLAMGPYAAFPIIGSLYIAGAGLGTTVAIFTSWALIGAHTIPFEGGLFGFKFVLIKVVMGVIFSMIAGGLAYLLESIL